MRAVIASDAANSWVWIGVGESGDPDGNEQLSVRGELSGHSGRTRANGGIDVAAQPFQPWFRVANLVVVAQVQEQLQPLSHIRIGCKHGLILGGRFVQIAGFLCLPGSLEMPPRHIVASALALGVRLIRKEEQNCPTENFTATKQDQGWKGSTNGTHRISVPSL